MLGRLAQLVRVRRSHRRGHWFEPSIAHHSLRNRRYSALNYYYYERTTFHCGTLRFEENTSGFIELILHLTSMHFFLHIFGSEFIYGNDSRSDGHHGKMGSIITRRNLG